MVLNDGAVWDPPGSTDATQPSASWSEQRREACHTIVVLPTPEMIGETIAHYRILAKIGEGNMGEVWKARDTRLDRLVAIKRLKSDRVARFEQERRAIAALNHPNICALYDIGPDYLVMEHVEGSPLSGPLPVDRAVKLAIQIAAALEEAHGKGILHRDLKPANILETAKGTVKLLDFGLAKLAADVDSTQTMAVMGTPIYMAPEQAEGKPADQRSDVFSFGTVLYEMLAGRRAFDSLAAVVRDSPKPLEAPAEVVRIVMRCLAKAPSDRFQTMADVKAALERVAAQPVQRQPSIAVLPFANMSRDPDDEYFSDGLAQEIMNTLAHLPGLKVTARTSAFAFRGKEQDIRKIAEVLNVRTILEGSVRRSGSRIRVTAQLINAEDGYHLWSERYDREMTDIFAMQDEIAASIAAALEVKLEGKPVARPHQPDLRAYEAFLRARHEMLNITLESLARAKQLLEQAIEFDAAYSEPYAELGQYYPQALMSVRNAHEAMPAARAQAQKALERTPSNARAHGVLCAVAGLYDYNWHEAGEQYRLAMAADLVPSEVRARCAINYLLPLRRIEEAVEQYEKALEQDPLNAFVRGAFALVLGIAEMHDRALIEAQKAVEVDANLWLPLFAIAFSYSASGKLDQARAPAERSVRAAPWRAQAVGLLAGIFAGLGERQRADELVRKLSDMPPIGRLFYHLLNSSDDTTVDWYATMVQKRDPLAVPWNVLKPLRASPRWPALAKMMNLPPKAES